MSVPVFGARKVVLLLKFRIASSKDGIILEGKSIIEVLKNVPTTKRMIGSILSDCYLIG